ncbi:hypothetical protein Ari01nite_29240 [Paractinoplanes rishiriensis]|uniref:Uncharacterized protein n=1 Tax=Paractinoplanes rishiriensis TaxID=1050105 RepID=A0A919JXH6_9ACTN|nr:hypothetical protein Ari01nite_29240 [Actinoplanes rishiriensis]
MPAARQKRNARRCAPMTERSIAASSPRNRALPPRPPRIAVDPPFQCQIPHGRVSAERHIRTVPFAGVRMQVLVRGIVGGDVRPRRLIAEPVVAIHDGVQLEVVGMRGSTALTRGRCGGGPARGRDLGGGLLGFDQGARNGPPRRRLRPAGRIRVAVRCFGVDLSPSIRFRGPAPGKAEPNNHASSGSGREPDTDDMWRPRGGGGVLTALVTTMGGCRADLLRRAFEATGDPA